MVNGCIPAILADDYEFPFEHVLKYPDFTVKIAESDAERVEELLRSIPTGHILSKQQALYEVAHHFVYREGTDMRVVHEEDALDTLLQALVTRKRFLRNSPLRFWKEPLSFG